MPDLIVTHITSIAASEGFTRGIDPDVGPLDVGPHDKDVQLAAPLPDMMMFGGREGAVQLADHYAIAPDTGVYGDDAVQDHDDGLPIHRGHVQVGPRSENDLTSVGAQIPTLAQIPTQRETEYLPAKRLGRGVDSLQSLQQRVLHMAADTIPSTADDDGRSRNNEDSAFTISVTAALRD